MPRAVAAVKRVVLVARQLAHGGAERQVVALARELGARGVDVHLLVFYSGGAFDAELVAAGIALHCLDKQGRWDAAGFIWRFVSTLRRLEPSAVYSFLDVPNILAVLAWWFVWRPRLVWSIRAAGMEMHHYDWLNRSLPWVEARLSRWADLTIANSQAGAAWAVRRGFPRDRLCVVENGIDTRRFRPDAAGRARLRALWGIPDGVCLVGLVARLDPMKDHKGFLHACAALRVVGDEVHFVCVGVGDKGYQGELVALAHRLGLEKRMVWAGSQADMAAVHSAIDIACSASAFGEGFSNSIGEAMACGTPCVVSDVGDSARIVGPFGEVVPPGDAQAMCDAIGRMRGRIRLEPHLHTEVRMRIETEFSLERMVTRTEKLLFGDV
nr:putative glycosyl transferase, group 1 [uncultured bacterium]